MRVSPSPIPAPSVIWFRTADPGDAEPVARLHAESWRRHYRGAYADSFLDGNVVADRLAGFVHVIFDHDDRWGSLVDNLHVIPDRHRAGIGKTLLTSAARAVTQQAANARMYLWVLEQNTAARRFYRALGGRCVESAPVPPPGGVPGRLAGSPCGLRMAWPDAGSLLRRR